MAEVRCFFSGLGLDEYIEAILAEGFDDARTLLLLDADELQTLVPKLGHRTKLKAALKELKEAMASPAEGEAAPVVLRDASEGNVAVVSDRIIIEVGSVKFATARATLNSEHARNSIFADRVPGFIDRSPLQFNKILDFLRQGWCVLPQQDLHMLRELRSEAEFYGLVGLQRLIDETYPMRKFYLDLENRMKCTGTDDPDELAENRKGGLFGGSVFGEGGKDYSERVCGAFVCASEVERRAAMRRVEEGVLNLCVHTLDGEPVMDIKVSRTEIALHALLASKPLAAALTERFGPLNDPNLQVAPPNAAGGGGLFGAPAAAPVQGGLFGSGAPPTGMCLFGSGAPAPRPLFGSAPRPAESIFDTVALTSPAGRDLLRTSGRAACSSFELLGVKDGDTLTAVRRSLAVS